MRQKIDDIKSETAPRVKEGMAKREHIKEHQERYEDLLLSDWV